MICSGHLGSQGLRACVQYLWWWLQNYRRISISHCANTALDKAGWRTVIWHNIKQCTGMKCFQFIGWASKRIYSGRLLRLLGGGTTIDSGGLNGNSAMLSSFLFSFLHCNFLHCNLWFFMVLQGRWCFRSCNNHVNDLNCLHLCKLEIPLLYCEIANDFDIQNNGHWKKWGIFLRLSSVTDGGCCLAGSLYLFILSSLCCNS